MPIYEFEGKRPEIADDAWVFPDAVVIGDVRLGSGCFVGAGAVLRGDYGRIVIGDETSVQEGVILHARNGDVCEVGSRVQLGHGCTLHNCRVHDSAVIGVGAVVSDFAVVGEWAIVAEGAVVRTRFEVPPEKVVAGVPAKVVTDVSDEMKAGWDTYKDLYAELARSRYPSGLKRID